MRLSYRDYHKDPMGALTEVKGATVAEIAAQLPQEGIPSPMGPPSMTWAEVFDEAGTLKGWAASPNDYREIPLTA